MEGTAYIGDKFWQPTMQLRFVEKAVFITKDTSVMKKILQQAFISDIGNLDWRDVPLVEIEE